MGDMSDENKTGNSIALNFPISEGSDDHDAVMSNSPARCSVSLFPKTFHADFPGKERKTASFTTVQKTHEEKNSQMKLIGENASRSKSGSFKLSTL
ncbi:hypothetical protein AVEN_40527-1 [Araneus ventricosus]|uniref:Uncharacterized protein n=1 Tax=Araneus ventricosus TaxID=182803 RepID=A0A4Y2LZG3_ARAVE|nr:hypothetical protein AVEN_40527-1 [Araneus ventricosus]